MAKILKTNDLRTNSDITNCTSNLQTVNKVILSLVGYLVVLLLVALFALVYRETSEYIYYVLSVAIGVIAACSGILRWVLHLDLDKYRNEDKD